MTTAAMQEQPAPTAATQRDSILEVRSVTKAFGGNRAVDDCSFNVTRRTITGLIGPNGAGKSTLLALLAGALPPSGGRIERRPGIRLGWAPERPAHYGRLSTRENLQLFARLENVGDVAAAIDRVVQALELPDDNRPSAALSSGNRQRLNLALALLADPDVLVLDEPSASLDERARRELWAMLSSLKRRGGAVVFATHDDDEVARLADTVVALSDGHVLSTGPVEKYAHERAETARTPT